MGQLVNFLGGKGGKYINFRAKSKFFVVIYKLGDFFPTGFLGGGPGGAWPPSAPR